MREFYRKIFHMAFGLAIAALIFFTPKGISLSLLALGTFIGVIFTDAILRGYQIPVISQLIESLERQGVHPGKGALYFAISSVFCVVFFEKGIVVPAIVAFSVLDGIAGIVGTYFGRHTIVNGKTAEGTLAGMAVTVLALMPLIPIPESALASFVAGMVELLSPIDDNLLIPVSVCIVLTLAGSV
jgi:phytol kinase